VRLHPSTPHVTGTAADEVHAFRQLAAANGRARFVDAMGLMSVGLVIDGLLYAPENTVGGFSLIALGIANMKIAKVAANRVTGKAHEKIRQARILAGMAVVSMLASEFASPNGLQLAFGIVAAALTTIATIYFRRKPPTQAGREAARDRETIKSVHKWMLFQLPIIIAICSYQLFTWNMHTMTRAGLLGLVATLAVAWIKLALGWMESSPPDDGGEPPKPNTPRGHGKFELPVRNSDEDDASITSRQMDTAKK
jgi:hypothetical protein